MRQTSGVPRPESQPERELRLWPHAPRVEPLRFRRAPLLAAALCFALGEALRQLLPAASRPTILLLFAALALAALTLLALRRSLRLATPAIAALWIAAGLWATQIEPAPSPQTALLTYADGLSRTVQGRVVRIRTLPAHSLNADGDSDPDQWDDAAGNTNPETSVDLDLSAIEDVTPDTSRMVPIEGGVRATLLAVDPTQPGLFADAIERLVRSPEAARAMGEAGQRAVRERFNWDVESFKLLNLYREILEPGNLGGRETTPIAESTTPGITGIAEWE